jgi:integrase
MKSLTNRGKCRIKTLAHLRDRYLEVLAHEDVKASVLSNCQTYFRHLLRILGDLPLADFSREQLQVYVNQRGSRNSKDNVGEMTIRQELSCFRLAWNWGREDGLTTGVFPSKGLQFHKPDKKPPLMIREEIERRVSHGASEDLWESLYLQTPEVDEVLAIAEVSTCRPFIYPMFCMAAFTGARRRELIASQRADFSFARGLVAIRETDRLRRITKLRHVPLSTRLENVMEGWFQHHPGGQMTFARASISRKSGLKHACAPLTCHEADEELRRTLAGTRWECIRGWYVLRQSFIAACVGKGVDQRILDEWTGHSTIGQRRRYRHLYDRARQEASKLVFG